MTKRDAGSGVLALAAGALLAFMPAKSPAQSAQPQPNQNKAGKFGPVGPEVRKDGKAVPSGPTPRRPDGKVDLEGVWTPANFANYGGAFDLQPWAAALMKERRDNLSKDDPEGFCLPAGVPRISPFPQKTVQTSKLLVILEEGNIHSYRQIFLDGRGHSGQDQLWMGDSIGHWDGDTLVVDTVGFNDKTWITGQGVPHTDQLHVVERYSRPDLGHLQIDITLEDPGAFTKPHSFQRIYNLMENTDLLEYVCNEFNIDKDHLVGK